MLCVPIELLFSPFNSPTLPHKKVLLEIPGLTFIYKTETQQGTFRACLTRALIEMLFQSTNSLTTAPHLHFFIIKEFPCLYNSDSNN